jgi:hypothetical protein
MGDQRIIKQADGWHFKIRGGNTIGPFADQVAAELALSNYCERWKQRTDVAPGRWRNWRRSPTPLAATPATPIDVTEGGRAPVIDGPALRNSR